MAKNTNLINLNGLYAGLFAASGSLFGKLTGSSIRDFEFVEKFEIFEQNIRIIQILSFILMIGFNALNIRFYVIALHTSTTTLNATVISTASNYFFSFLYGIFLFGEEISILSITGIILIFIGLIFLNNSNSVKEVENKTE